MSLPKTRKWLTKGGLVREDSDDELGYEDHPWVWIYGDGDKGSNENGENRRKRKASAMASASKTPIGARMGTFEVRIGDAVLLKSPEEGKDWAGLVCAFSETDEDGEEEMCANIQWFCSPGELVGSKKAKSQTDVLPNESYITADFNMNPLTAINGKATVLSKAAFFKKYPKGQPPKSKTAARNYAKTILCRRGVKQRTLQYTEEFTWDEIYKGPESLLEFIDWIKDQTKTRKRTVKEETAAPDQDFIYKPDTDKLEPTTPRKRRKTTSATQTPRSSTKIAKYATPTHKRIIIKKPLEITPLGTRVLSPATFLSSPYAHARSTLHVSAVPTTLPCRSNEFSTVYTYLHSAITEGTGTCIYISGTPGTGKTATVREVVAQLHLAVSMDELDDFAFVEINGMKVTEPSQSYSLLWEALKGDRVSPNHALSLLEHEFSHPSPRRTPCVVLMDELDQLVTKSQSVMYNFFNWPALRHSRLIVLAVANTMDLPERTLSNKISSRLGLTRITFPGYTHTQLMEIIISRLQNVPGNIVDADAIQFASRKVAAVSGDARRALDICRRAVEIAEQQASKQQVNGNTQSETSDEDENEEADPNTPSRRDRSKAKKAFSGQLEQTTTKSRPEKSGARVTIYTIKQAIAESTSSPVHLHLRSLSLSSKLFLAAFLSRIRRTGVSECTFGELLVEAKRIADSFCATSPEAENAVHRFLLYNEGREQARISSMTAAAAELTESGVIAMEARTWGFRFGRVRLRIGEDEVRETTKGDPEMKEMGIDA